MTVVSVAVGGVSIGILYRADLNHQRARLAEIVQGLQSRLEIVPGPTLNAERRRAALASYEVKLGRMWDRLRNHQGLGETGEVSLAFRDEEDIIWRMSLDEPRRKDAESTPMVPWDSKLAAPMRRALSGEAGTTIGRDYRGVKVVAAYVPLNSGSVGLVVKRDLAEVRAPFIIAAGVASVAGFFVILVGAFAIHCLSGSLVRKHEETKARLIQFADNIDIVVWMITPDYKKVTYISPAFEQIFGRDAKDLFDRPELFLADITHMDLPAPIAGRFSSS